MDELEQSIWMMEQEIKNVTKGIKEIVPHFECLSIMKYEAKPMNHWSIYVHYGDACESLGGIKELMDWVATRALLHRKFSL